MPDKPDRLGSGICDAVANRLDAIAAGAAQLHPDNIKFLAEAVIATALAGSKEALALNRRLGDLLFSTKVRPVLYRNPQAVTIYALPTLFLHHPPAEQTIIEGLFRHLHEDHATQSLSYPAYRNSEMDYVHAKLTGRSFYMDPFVQALRTFPWLTRDQLYGLTHIHFYNSDFGRGAVAYPSPAIDLLEALIARTYTEGDADLLLELILCYATTEGASPARLAHHDHLCTRLLALMIGPDEEVPVEACFTNIYHPLFVAWIYHTVRGNAFDGTEQAGEAAQLSSLGKVMMAFGRGDPLAIFGAYADHVEAFGPSPILETTLALHGSLISEALKSADDCRP